jgi:mono/diheme cytochrome c family protein
LTRDDIGAIRAYLATLTPVHNPIPSPELRWPLNYRVLLRGWDWLFFRPGILQPDQQKSTEWNRGRYLVEGPGHCGACHTPKNAMGGDENSQHLQGSVLQGWLAPRIAGESWSVDDIAEYLKSGTNALATASGPMAEAVENSTSRLSLADLRAIAVYLKDQPAAAEKPPAALAADDPLMQAGKAIYADECAACHTLDGSGIARLFPSLKGRASVQAAHADSLINVVLNGTRAAATPGAPTAPAMPAFRWNLTDDQVAAVTTYIRNAWGNAAPAVSADSVKAARQAMAQR